MPPVVGAVTLVEARAGELHAAEAMERKASLTTSF